MRVILRRTSWNIWLSFCLLIILYRLSVLALSFSFFFWSIWFPFLFCIDSLFVLSIYFFAVCAWPSPKPVCVTVELIFTSCPIISLVSFEHAVAADVFCSKYWFCIVHSNNCAVTIANIHIPYSGFHWYIWHNSSEWFVRKISGQQLYPRSSWPVCGQYFMCKQWNVHLWGWVLSEWQCLRGQ